MYTLLFISIQNQDGKCFVVNNISVNCSRVLSIIYREPETDTTTNTPDYPFNHLYDNWQPLRILLMTCEDSPSFNVCDIFHRLLSLSNGVASYKTPLLVFL